MTREEILKQAKVGGYALVRMEICDINKMNPPDDHNIICLKTWYGGVGVANIDVISIELPPQTDTEKLADALAEIERLKAKLAGGTAEKSIYPAQPANVKIPWSGGKCPVPLETEVRAHLRCGETWEATAEFCDWGRYVQETDDTGWHITAYEVLT